MKKRILSLVIAGMLFMCTAATSFGADEIETTEEATEVKRFTLQEAIDYAIENSVTLKTIEADIEKTEIEVTKAGKGYSSLKDYSLADLQSRIVKDIQPDSGDPDKLKITYNQTFDTSIDTILQSVRIKEGYYKEATKMGLLLAEKGKEMAIKGIGFSVESSYFGVLHAQEKYEIQESTLATAKQNLDNINKKYELGMASPLELMNFEIAYSQAEMGYKSAQRALEYAKMSFNKAIGLPLDSNVILTDELIIEEPETIDIEEKVTEALENRMEIISAQKQYELDKMNFDISSTFVGTYDYKNAKYTLESSEYALADAKVTVELSVRKAYMDMMDAYEALTILDKTIMQVEKVYTATETRYDLGMATENEVIEALNQAKEMKLQRSQAALGYRLAKKQFELSYGIGLGY